MLFVTHDNDLPIVFVMLSRYDTVGRERISRNGPSNNVATHLLHPRGTSGGVVILREISGIIVLQIKRYVDDLLLNRNHK